MITRTLQGWPPSLPQRPRCVGARYVQCRQFQPSTWTQTNPTPGLKNPNPNPNPFGGSRSAGVKSRGFAACFGRVFSIKKAGRSKSRLDQEDPHPAQSFEQDAAAHGSSPLRVTPNVSARLVYQIDVLGQCCCV